MKKKVNTSNKMNKGFETSETRETRALILSRAARFTSLGQGVNRMLYDFIRFDPSEHPSEHKLNWARAAGRLKPGDVIQYYTEKNGGDHPVLFNPVLFDPSVHTIQWAAVNGHWGALKFHLENPNINYDVDTLVEIALKYTNYDVYSLIEIATVYGHLHIIRRLMRPEWVKSLMVNDEECTGCIDTAAYHGRLDIIRFFMEIGPLRLRGNPIDAAATSGKLSIVQYLVARHGELCGVNPFSVRVTIDIAIQNGHWRIVDYLVRAKVNGISISGGISPAEGRRLIEEASSVDRDIMAARRFSFQFVGTPGWVYDKPCPCYTCHNFPNLGDLNENIKGLGDLREYTIRW